MIETIDHPAFSSRDFDVRGKLPGISAIVRLRNEQDFAVRALASIQPFVDEIVIVFNDCSDRTPEIVAEFARENPNQARAFHYVPRVFPQGSEQHRRLPANSAHSLVHYSNFALSKTAYQTIVKWDGDQIAEPRAFERVVRELRALKPGTLAWWLSPWRCGYWWYTGVNLWDAEQRVGVLQSRSLIGRRRDHGFFPAGRWIIFKHHPRVEYLFTRLLAHKFVGCVFYHLKGMKKDRGIGVYQLEENPRSHYRRHAEQARGHVPLYTWAEFCAIEPSVRSLPDPASLDIHPITER